MRKKVIPKKYLVRIGGLVLSFINVLFLRCSAVMESLEANDFRVFNDLGGPVAESRISVNKVS